MGIKEKLANAKKTKWVSEGLSEDEVQSIIESAKISARIESNDSQENKCENNNLTNKGE